jgi:phosphoribosylformylglycinamidine synthase
VPPAINLGHERALQTLLPQLIGAGLVASAHDCAEGGLAVALAECTFGEAPIGATIEIGGVTGPSGVPVAHATLFSESAGRVILAVEPGHLATVLDRAAEAAVEASVIGTTGGDMVTVRVDGEVAVAAPVAQLQAVWAHALEDALASPARP